MVRSQWLNPVHPSEDRRQGLTKLADQVDLQAWVQRELDREQRGRQKRVGVRGTSYMECLISILHQRSRRLKSLEAVPKTKGHIKAVIHRLYEKAMLWEMVEWQRNPMEFVEIKGISKRQKRPVILTVEQFFLILPQIPQPYRMMALRAQCSGLRVVEVLAIEKPDTHFGKLSMQIVRAVVHGRLKLVKTEYSEDELPLDPDLAAILLDFIREAEREALAKVGDEGAGIIESDLLLSAP